MTFVLGRDGGVEAGPTAELGRYRASDGSEGARLALDLDGPHAALVVGKRGYGKSYTLGVIAEELARTRGVAPIVVDPMGVFTTLADGVTDTDHAGVPARVVDEPTVSPTALDPQSWCALLGLAPDGSAGSLVWQAAQHADSVAAMREYVRSADAVATDVRAACNHLDLAASWDVFDTDGLTAETLAATAATVVDVSGLATAPANAVVRSLAEGLYTARVQQRIDRLPWLLVDEAHTFFDGVADESLRRLLTRGRSPGVSLVLATQRPSAVPPVGISQADLVCAHRLTSRSDLDALAAARPTYMDSALGERLPTAPGEVVIIDDVTESVHAARVRTRDTPHDGGSPSVRAHTHF